MRHAGEAGGAVPFHPRPEGLLRHRRVVEDDRVAGHEVRVDHRHAVGIVRRQRGDRPLAVGEGQVLGDRGRVGPEVVVRQPDQLRAAGRARGREQHRERGVQRDRFLVPALQDPAAGAVGAMDGVRPEQLRDPPLRRGPVAPGQQHRVAGPQGTDIGGDGFDLVVGFQRDQPPFRTERRDQRVGLCQELGVAVRRPVLVDQREPVGEAIEINEKSIHQTNALVMESRAGNRIARTSAAAPGHRRDTGWRGYKPERRRSSSRGAGGPKRPRPSAAPGRDPFRIRRRGRPARSPASATPRPADPRPASAGRSRSPASRPPPASRQCATAGPRKCPPR